MAAWVAAEIVWVEEIAQLGTDKGLAPFVRTLKVGFCDN
jgi:hypothetical protein